MSKYDKLKQRNTIQRTEEKPKLDLAVRASEEMAKDARRTAEVYRNAGEILDDIDARFEKATGLNGTDVAFLMLATALQISRWVIIGVINNLVNTKIDESRMEHNDKKIKEKEDTQKKSFLDRHGDEQVIQSKEHRSWVEIITDSVPYDITKGCIKGAGGNDHRVNTLGHDPVLGWIVGPINILSDTITLDKTFRCATYNVCMEANPKHWEDKTTLCEAFHDAYDSIQEDSVRFPAAVFKQAMHMQSDFFTKMGVPIPVLEAFAPKLASKLYNEGYDTLMMMKDIAVCGIQAVSAVLINLLISLIHGLYYDPQKYKTRELYEVKTRKILRLSNILASSLNVVTVTVVECVAGLTENIELAKKGAAFFDLGGLIVTTHRLISDTQFIRQVKSEFLEKEWQNAVLGEEYSFLEEAKKYEP